jgi:hypothetical protein
VQRVETCRTTSAWRTERLRGLNEWNQEQIITEVTEEPKAKGEDWAGISMKLPTQVKEGQSCGSTVSQLRKL